MRWWRAPVALGVVALLAACSERDDGADPTTAAVPATKNGTTTTVTTTTAAVPTTPAPMTIASTSTTTTTTVPLARPPVPTLVPEVPAGSLTRGQLNPLSVDNSREILPEHVPIIEAYLTVLHGEYQVMSTAPIDPDALFLATEPVTEESRVAVRAALAERRDLGHVLDVSQGVTFRRYVVGPVTDTAVLYDCELAGHFWVFAETGELVPPDDVWVGGPGRIEEVGVRYRMVLQDGRWLVDTSQIDPSACA